MSRWLTRLLDRWAGIDFTIPNVLKEAAVEDWMGVPLTGARS